MECFLLRRLAPVSLLFAVTSLWGCDRPVVAPSPAQETVALVHNAEAAIRRPRHPMIAMQELNRPPRIDAQSGFQLLPEQGSGFYHFRGADRPGTDSWGRPTTIQCIQATGQRWATDYPDRPRIGVGDISRRLGGRFLPHQTHRDGRDMDLRPMTRSGEHKVHVRHANYSSTRTGDLVRVLLESCDVRVIYFNDWRLIREFPKVKKSRGHNDHLHVRLRTRERKPQALGNTAREPVATR